jgi:hypothetical protein
VQALVAAGTTTLYFATEHASVEGLRGELGATRTFERLTDARTNNKFVLVRATYQASGYRQQATGQKEVAP